MWQGHKATAQAAAWRQETLLCLSDLDSFYEKVALGEDRANLSFDSVNKCTVKGKITSEEIEAAKARHGVR